MWTGLAILTLQTFISCTSRPDVCQCLVVQKLMDNISKKLANNQVACGSNLRLVVRSFTLGLQSGVGSCIMAGLPTYLVQKLNVGTVPMLATCAVCRRFLCRSYSPIEASLPLSSNSLLKDYTDYWLYLLSYNPHVHGRGRRHMYRRVL